MDSVIFNSALLPSDSHQEDAYERLPPAFSGMVVIIVKEADEDSAEITAQIRDSLAPFQPVVETRLTLSPDAPVHVFGLKCRAVERCRDALKRIFFERHLKAKHGRPFCLSNYITFISPLKRKRIGEVMEHTFVHGVGRFYRFWIAEKRLPNRHLGLLGFLKGLPVDCPNHLFLSGPKASKGEWSFGATSLGTKRCALVSHAVASKNMLLRKRAHENLERFLMLHDEMTFACEVPLWLEPSDFSNFEELFKVSSCITGHIDILSCEPDGKIGVWDYKPNARAETKAAQQVAFYMLMLAKRTGIPLTELRGGYFDEDDAFEVQLSNLNLFA